MMEMEGVRRNLVELKARVPDLEVIRNRLHGLGASYVGRFHQKDTYFEVPKGRLKLREVVGEEEARLIYYERADTAGPRRSRVFIIRVQRTSPFIKRLLQILKVRVVVEKVREIYRHEGTQIHLDRVKGLGTFVEFEREVDSTPQAVEEGRAILETLMRRLGIAPGDLEPLSYGDLLQPG